MPKKLEKARKESLKLNLFKMEEKQKAELEELVQELEKIKGRHTELITVYVPAGYDINSV